MSGSFHPKKIKCKKENPVLRHFNAILMIIRFVKNICLKKTGPKTGLIFLNPEDKMNHSVNEGIGDIQKFDHI